MSTFSWGRFSKSNISSIFLWIFKIFDVMERGRSCLPTKFHVYLWNIPPNSQQKFLPFFFMDFAIYLISNLFSENHWSTRNSKTFSVSWFYVIFKGFPLIYQRGYCKSRKSQIPFRPLKTKEILRKSSKIK